MKQKIVIFGLAGTVLSALFLLLWIEESSWLFNLPGLIVVFGGTVLMTMLSQSFGEVLTLFPRVVSKLKNPSVEVLEEETAILRLAESYRQGRMQVAENELNFLPEGIFKYGARLILDMKPMEDISRLLQWRSGALRDKEGEDIRILRTMASYAPAFGMLGTLFGLVQMLDGLGDNGLGQLGKIMGFAMMTTVYGLVAANLVFKPLAIQLERRAKQQQVWQNTQVELVLMLYRRIHPNLIREYIRAVIGDVKPEYLEKSPLQVIRA